MRVVCLSDTHHRHREVAIPEGDVLVVAGDITFGRKDSLEQVAEFGRFLAALPHPVKVVVAGNHDFALHREAEKAREALGDCVYLEDSGAVVAGGLKVYGSPWTPALFGTDWAFTLPSGPLLRERFAKIPSGLDILISHGPACGRQDLTMSKNRIGSEDLAEALRGLALPPRWHVFGHVHEDAGQVADGATTYVNCAISTPSYEPSGKPAVLEIEVRS